MIKEPDSRIPTPSTVWQLWHSDTFDQDSSPSVQSTGQNIVDGLYVLWLYTLQEGILDNGNASFSRFHLTWGPSPASRVDIAVNPFDNSTLLKLRQWVGFTSQNQHSEDGRDGIVLKLAQLHYDLLQKSNRWKASAIDWSAEARELLAHVELISDPKDL